MYQNKPVNENFFWSALPAVIIFVIFYLIRGVTFQDDAYGFYRFSANWALGYGPVYNVGEYVEAYSSFLWTLILAVGAYLSFDLVKFAPAVNMFIAVGCIILTAYICTFIRFSRSQLIILIITLLYALSYGFYYYSASGMDTLISSLVLLLNIISFYKSKNSGNYLLVLPSLFLLNIVRAEGPLYSTIMIAILIYFVYKEEKKIPAQLFATAAIFIFLTTLLFAVRYAVYKEFIPTPVMAKGFATYSIKKAVFTGDINALRDFIMVIIGGIKYEAPQFLLGAWIPFWVLFRRKNLNDFLFWLMASVIAANVFVSLWSGGDYMPFKRHIIPVLPILIISIAWAANMLLCEHWNGLTQKRKAALSIIIGLLVIFWTGFFVRPMMLTTKYVASEERNLNLLKLGKALHEIPVNTVLLTDMMGILPYYAGHKVYVRDILGWADLHNAKYGDEWGASIGDGMGVCGRTDINYSFTAPFDIFFYNSPNIHKKFISFCLEKPPLCNKYRFFKSKKWPQSYFHVIANINHPVADVLRKEFDAYFLPIDANLI